MLCLCDKRPENSDIDPCKDFAQILRRKEFEEAYIELTEDSTEKLKDYIQLLKDVSLDEDTFHLYYGQVKKITTAFLNFYNHSVENLIKKSDYYTNTAKKDDLILLIEQTISGHHMKQAEFAKTFLPVQTSWENRVYEEIEKLYEEHTNKLKEIKEVIYFRLDRQSKVEEFVKNNFPISLRKTSEIFDTAHLYVGKMLSDRTREIRTSLEQIHQRLRNNLANIQEERDDVMQALLSQLYEKNKESIAVLRQEKKNSIAQAEVNRCIDSLRSKVERLQSHSTVRRLEKEVSHWQSKLDYLNEIANNIASLRKQQADTVKEQKETEHLKCQVHPACRRDCARVFPGAYSARMEELRDRIVNETRALVTFFAVRGGNRIVYPGGAGQYYVDEYNHQVYVSGDGYSNQHTDCAGNLVPEPPEQKYLFDEHGRYVMVSGERLYQLAPCTSQYRLNSQNYFEKVTQDCGHSLSGSKSCRMQIRDPKDVTILPHSEPVDISKSLPAETVRYLWSAFGSVLPEALRDVARDQPNNPVHYLAHKLLYHKYKRTKSELQQERKEAERYRENIFKERRERAQAASRQWKARQVKRRRPEESDDAGARAYHAAMIAEEMFIIGLNRDLDN